MRRSEIGQAGAATAALVCVLAGMLALVGCSGSSEGGSTGSGIGSGGTGSGGSGGVIDQSDGGTGSAADSTGSTGQADASGTTGGAGDADAGPRVEPDCTTGAQCDDGDPCTDDACNNGTCSNPHNTAPCDDGDGCTEGDACSAGACMGAAKSCDDTNDCTDDKCVAGVCHYDASVAGECKMRIEVKSPLRAAVVTGDPIVGVTGTVVSPAGPVASMTLNGATVAVGASGGFSVAYTADHALNVLQFEATNTLDQSARASQALLYGEEWHPLGEPLQLELLDTVIAAFLSPEFFDDDDTATLDDVATLVTLVVEGFDLAAVLPDPLFPADSQPSFAWCEWDVTISDLSLSVDSVDITPINGGLALSIVFKDFYTYVSAVAPDIGCPDAIGPATAQFITADMTIGLSVVDGKPSLTVGDIDVEMIGAAVNIEDGFAEYFDWLVNFFEDDLADMIETQIEEMVPNSILPLLQGVLEQSTSFEREITLPALRDGGNDATLTVAIALEDVEVATSGADLVMKFGSASDALVADAAAMPGTLSSVGCLSGTLPHPSSLLPGQSRVEGALSEDVANQLLHALWASGYTHMTLGDELLGDTLGGFGISELVMELAPRLPPIATSCTSNGDLELQMGDVEINADFMAGGGPASMHMYASLTIGLSMGVVVDPAGANLLAVESITPGLLTIDIVESSGLSFSDEILEQLLAAALMDQLGGDLLLGLAQSFPVPVIDVGGLVPGLAAGTELTFSPESFFLQAAHLVVGGTISEP